MRFHPQLVRSLTDKIFPRLDSEPHLQAQMREHVNGMLEELHREGWHFIRFHPVEIKMPPARRNPMANRIYRWDGGDGLPPLDELPRFPLTTDELNVEIKISFDLDDEEGHAKSRVYVETWRKDEGFRGYMREELWERAVGFIARKLNPSEPIYVKPDN